MQIKLVWLMLSYAASIHAFSFFNSTPQFTLMLDPAGDAQYAGRKIDDMAERAVTLQCSHALKNALEHRYSHVRVLLTRAAGETIPQLQNANFANRAQADCFISVHCYQIKEQKPSFTLYYFSYGNDFITRTFDLALYEYDQAHILSLPTTHRWSSFMRQTLENSLYKTVIDFKGIHKLPLKPLIGIKAPAFIIELGLPNNQGWTQCIEPILASLDPIIKSQW